MSTTGNVYEISIKGMSCPTPLNIVARELVKVPLGSRFTIITDDYVCFMMLMRFLKILGESIEETRENDGLYVITGVRNA